LTGREPDDERPPNGADEKQGEPSEPTQQESRALEPVEPSKLEPISPEELESLRKERDELQDQLLRKRAELDNYRKRMERDRQRQQLEARATLIRELLPSLDNLDRALSAEGSDESLRTGVELIHRDLLTLLEAEGLEAVNPEGEHFDPQTQQALAHEAVPGFEDGMIVEVFRKGYKLGDRLLRPALVRVAKGEEEDEGQDPEAVH
jgi:molecular chaperone GrpE